MSQTLWDSLPADIQQIVQEASNEARDYDRELVSADVESTIKTFEEQGCEVIEVDKQEWMDAVKPVYEKHVCGRLAAQPAARTLYPKIPKTTCKGDGTCEKTGTAS